jgi:site-specific DNA recombinase
MSKSNLHLVARGQGLRAASYARYSSDLQKDKSIDDQFAENERIAERENFDIVARFNDRAKTAATMFERDGLHNLLEAARNREFDVVIVYDLSRLSRDQEDTAHILKLLNFYDIDIWTGEGKVTALSAGLRAIINQQAREDIGRNVRRGHNGLIRAGKVPGRPPYGYRRTARKAEIEIDPETAAIVRRIYRDYVGGASPRAIAVALTNEAIPSPSGGRWNFRTLISCDGHNERLGLLANPFYTGRIIWNRRRVVRNPDGGKRGQKASPENIIEAEAPHLRIIEQVLFDAAQEVRAKRKINKRTGRVPFLPRADHLLAGLLRCGICNGPIRVRGKACGITYICCVAADRHKACAHKRNYNLEYVTQEVITGVCEMLRDSDAIKATLAGHAKERAAESKGKRAELAKVHAERNRVQVRIDRLVEAIDTSDTPVAALMAKLNGLEVERVALAERERLLEAETNIVDLHPKALKVFNAAVEVLATALAEDITPEVRAAFRNLIDCIVLHPAERGEQLEFTPYARPGALLGGINLFPTVRSAEKILQERGVSSCDSVSSVNSRDTVQQIVSLGRWTGKRAA